MFFIALAALSATVLVFTRREDRRAPAVAAMASERSGESEPANKTEPFDDSSLRTSAPLPPEGTPWAMSKSQLLPRALRGDKVAAYRLFRDTQNCGKALMLQNELDSLASVQPSTMPEKKNQERQLLMQQVRDKLRGIENMCTEGDAAEVARDVDQILLAAAQAGDKTAAACYLDASFHDMGRAPQEAELERYIHFGPQFAEAAVKDGNWSVVSVMAYAYGSGKKFGIYAGLVPVDPVKEYAYVKLQELGATGELKATKTERLNAIRASGSVSEADVQQSEAWAQDTFEKYFHEPLETDQPPQCFEPASASVNE